MDGRRVAQLRELAGLTQLELAAKSGLSLTTISDIERGAQQQPKLPTLTAIARALSTSIATILGDPEVEVEPEPATEVAS